MKDYKLMLCVLGFVLVFTIAVATAADAPPLTFKFTTANVPGAQSTEPGGLSNAGISVGQYEDSSGVLHGYMLKGKTVTTLDDPNGTNTFVSNIQYNGTNVVGYYFTNSGALVGFLYNGNFKDITGPTGATAAWAYGINDKGAIVGGYTDSNSRNHGFLLKGTKYRTLDVPRAASTVAEGINNKGNIVLTWTNSIGAIEASLYNGKTKKYKIINVPKAETTYVDDLNNGGDVVFQWIAPSGVSHGALLHAGKYCNVDYPKAGFTYCGGINDKSTIVGGYKTNTNGPFLGFEAAYK